MTLAIALLLFALALLAFLSKRLFRYLQLLQQEDYDSRRFFCWLVEKRLVDRKGSLTCAIAILFYLATDLPSLAFLLCAMSLATLAWWEPDPCSHGKLPLQMTKRGWRLWGCAFSLALFFVFLLLFCFYQEPFSLFLAALVLCQAAPLLLMGAVALLANSERQHQALYWRQAQEKLQQVAPFVIGITGSYGKSSTKQALGQLLQTSLGPTFWPERSINTSMGIARSVREGLSLGHRFAVIEMAAYGIGSIEQLCQLTPPAAAILTAVGETHLERFGSPEAILKAKGELPEALPEGSLLVCNGDEPKVRLLAGQFPLLRQLWYGFDSSHGKLDCQIEEIDCSWSGTRFALIWQGKRLETSTSLFGRHLIGNLAAAFTLAVALGADPSVAAALLPHLSGLPNRLQLVWRQGVAFLYDGYNSNIKGFEAALETLFRLPAERRWLITPGMIELGSLQEEYNRHVGQLAARHCDLAIIVGECNRRALVDGLAIGAMDRSMIFEVTDRQQAFGLVEAMMKKGDVILIENDLGDLYETELTF